MENKLGQILSPYAKDTASEEKIFLNVFRKCSGLALGYMTCKYKNQR